MKNFYLRREDDETGKSGIGRVAQGTQFDDKSCAIRWLSETPSLLFYGSIAEVKQVHGHDGKTVVEWEEDWRSKYQELQQKLRKLAENGDG